MKYIIGPSNFALYFLHFPSFMHYSYNYYEALFLQLLKHKQVCKRDTKVQEAIKQLLEQSAMSAM